MAEADYIQHYSEDSFWRKVSHFAKRAGRQVIEKSLYLYFAAQGPDTPLWAKTVIFGTLGYFILPADAISDVLPAVGYADDLGALTAAVAVVATYITPEMKQRAKGKLRDWFGEEELAAAPDE